jgi:hypothetical protein
MFASTLQRKTAMILSSEMSWHNGQKGVLVDDEDVLLHPHHHLGPNDTVATGHDATHCETMKSPRIARLQSQQSE